MSVHVISWVYALPPLREHLAALPDEIRVSPVVARAVLVKLADNANDAGAAFPSIERIERETEVVDRSVQKAIRCLVELGLLEVTERPGRSTVYRLQVGSPPSPARGESHSPPKQDVRGAAHSPGGESHAPGGESHAPEPSLTRQGTSLAPPSRRARDELWDAAAAVFGEVRTANERGRRNRELKQLREVGATADELRARAVRYRRRHPDWTFSLGALLNHWTSLEPPAVRPAAAAVCVECEVGGGRHAAGCSKAPAQRGEPDVGGRVPVPRELVALAGVITNDRRESS